jgi:hypothetical protein
LFADCLSRRNAQHLQDLDAVAAALVPLAGAGAAPLHRQKRPPVYLEDPGLAGVAVRPSYISFPLRGQTWTWIRGIRWRTWGGPVATAAYALLESCSFGRCTTRRVPVRLSRRRPFRCPTGSSYTRIAYRARGVTRVVHVPAYVCEND